MTDDRGQMTDDPVDRASAALARNLKGPGAAFDDRVMRAIAEPAKKRLWIVRALEPRHVRIPPVLVPLAAAAVLVVWFAGARFGERRAAAGIAPAVVAAVPRSDTVYVRFELVQPNARAVHLAGDFTDWKPDAIPLVRSASGTWSVTLPMPVGQHSYQFVVDGERWVPDPAAAVVDDGFGGRNSVIVVGPRGVVRS